MLILSNSLNLENTLSSNLFVFVFWLTWVQQARIVRLEQLNSELAAEIDHLRVERQRVA